jgi:hypothetical protein
VDSEDRFGQQIRVPHVEPYAQDRRTPMHATNDRPWPLQRVPAVDFTSGYIQRALDHSARVTKPVASGPETRYRLRWPMTARWNFQPTAPMKSTGQWTLLPSALAALVVASALMGRFKIIQPVAGTGRAV